MKVNLHLDFTFPAIIAILFIILKITKVITWSWIWVLCPIWISLIIALIAILWFIKN